MTTPSTCLQLLTRPQSPEQEACCGVECVTLCGARMRHPVDVTRRCDGYECSAAVVHVSRCSSDKVGEIVKVARPMMQNSVVSGCAGQSIRKDSLSGRCVGRSMSECGCCKFMKLTRRSALAMKPSEASTSRTCSSHDPSLQSCSAAEVHTDRPG
jgi:hypothetical protein